MSVADFFAFARERHATHLRRAAGLPRDQWTQDTILQSWRFTNVFRELDATTLWFAHHVREPLRSSPDVLLATVLFRWFCRQATGEAIFQQEALGLGGELTGETAWQALLRMGAPDGVDALRAAVLQYCGDGPYVTGAYIVKTPDGYSKLDGVLQCVRWFCEQEKPGAGFRDCYTQRQIAEHTLEHRGEVSLEDVWAWLRTYPYMGDFMAYEVVTDLRHTALLDRAPDIMTWANPGPGARRGLGRVFEGDPEHYGREKSRLNTLMQSLLSASQLPQNWPQQTGRRMVFAGQDATLPEVDVRGSWPAWEMREVEHTLCEFDKYERIREGGRGKRRYP